MSLVKKINIYIPKNENLPEGFSNLPPEDTFLVLKTGYSAFESVKNDIRVLSNDEIYRTIRTELEKSFQEERRTLKESLSKTEKELYAQQELYKKYLETEDEKGEKLVTKRVETYERLQLAYKEEREHMQSRIIALETQVAAANAKMREEAMKMVNHELENLKQILSEKDKQNDFLRKSLDKAVEKIDGITQKKTTVSLGKIGEKQFDDIARATFRDFEGFEIVDMHSMAGQGDFHLKFRGFTILADSKLYSNKVNSTSRDKIKRDLKKNEHIQFAWLVSLDTTIDKFDKAPFMFEWLTDNKCVCYVNELLKYEEPGEILRAVWYCCNTLYNIITNEEGLGGVNEINQLREQERKIKEIAQKMVKNNRERETIITQLRMNMDKNDEYLREILSEETNKMALDYYNVIIEWWNANIIEEKGEQVLTTTILWQQFKKDKETKIEYSSFKDILLSFLQAECIIKPKAKGGAFKVLNYNFIPNKIPK